MRISIYTLQFDTLLTTSDGLEYFGNIELFNSEFDPTLGTSAEFHSTGSIKVSVDDKWVLFQYSNIMGAGEIFMKRNSEVSDTTFLPTLLNNQFPVFPKTVTSNTLYSAYRPNDESYHFLSVQRDLKVKNIVSCDDIYGNNSGLYYETVHHLVEFNFTIDMKGIIDSKGVVASSSSMEWELTGPTSPVVIDTVTNHQINRRIVDFTEPENIKDLSWYSDYVLENGLSVLEEK